MANKFSADSTCVGVWTFENAANMGEDKLGKNNLLGNMPDVETSIITEGVQSGHFIPANADWIGLVDSSLSTGFPLRFTDGVNTKKDFSLAIWFYQTALSTIVGQQYILDKYNGGTNQRVISLGMFSSANTIFFKKGYNNGVSFEQVIYATPLTINKWYHLEIGYREYDKKYFFNIIDTANISLGTNLNSNFAQNTSTADIPFRFGRSVVAGSTAYGYLDELIIWNVKKTQEDITRVRNGTYNWKDVGNLSLNQNISLNMLGGG